jgi:hypothetical protein
MYSTLSTFQEPMFWLKALASANMESMYSTLETSQEPMFWLKAVCGLPRFFGLTGVRMTAFLNHYELATEGDIESKIQTIKNFIGIRTG